jgi:hypothetical protein
MMAPSLAEAAGVDDARREALARALELVRSHELHTILISLCDGSARRVSGASGRPASSASRALASPISRMSYLLHDLALVAAATNAEV